MSEPLSLTLGPKYMPALWDLHKHIARLDRSSEIVVVIRLQAPIVSEAIDIAILSGSLYLIGIRARGQWLEFANDAGLKNSSSLRDATPRLPGSRWIRVGDGIALSSYRALRVADMIGTAGVKRQELGYVGTPAGLIGEFAHWNGTLNAGPERLKLCVLIMLVCEALRFRSIERACADWIMARGPDAQSGRIVITPAMLDTVQNWRSKSLARDPDVTMTPPDLRDPLIS